MKEIYEASSGMGEVSESALKTYGKDKKTNNNLFISISKAVGLFFASQMFSTILITVYLVHQAIFCSAYRQEDSCNDRSQTRFRYRCG